jgi:hypothetical protein
MDIQIIDPTQHKGWDDLILSHPEGSFFHSSAWARVLSESYGYAPKYFAVIRNEKLVSLLPVMEVNSLFTGKRGVSLPFTDYCEPIIGPEVSLDDLLNCVVDTGKRSDWRSLELRFGQKVLSDRRIALKYLGHELKLGQDEDRLLSGFRDSTRRNIRKAIGEGVEVKSSNTTEGMKEFYRLNSLTRKEHGLPPQPYRFFVRSGNTSFQGISDRSFWHRMIGKTLRVPSTFISMERPTTNMGRPIKTINISGQTTWSCGRPSVGIPEMGQRASAWAGPNPIMRDFFNSNPAGERRNNRSVITGMT